MNRSRATELVQELLTNVAAQGRYASLVDRVWVFGSYARGAMEPGDIDIDIDVEHRRDRVFGRDLTMALAYGKDPYAEFRRELIGNRRSFELMFGGDAHEQFPEATVIYERGDSLERALERLHAITADPDASRAARDWMIPELEGLDKFITRPDRAKLSALVTLGWLRVERVVLADGEIAHDPTAKVQDALDNMLSSDSPLRRAAAMAVGYLQRERGVRPSAVWLEGGSCALSQMLLIRAGREPSQRSDPRLRLQLLRGPRGDREERATILGHASRRLRCRSAEAPHSQPPGRALPRVC
jgi:hypothetical protein